jgi:hypothetical protein
MGSSNSLADYDFGSDSDDRVSDELLAAWKADPRCAECGEPVRSALEAALLVGPNRVTHRERCFVPALVRRNPHLKLLTARLGAQEDTVPAKAPREPHHG